MKDHSLDSNLLLCICYFLQIRARTSAGYGANSTAIIIELAEGTVIAAYTSHILTYYLHRYWIFLI